MTKHDGPGEHRGQPRYEVTAYAELGGVNQQNQPHQVTNISLGGMCIETDELEPLGTRVELVLNFPDQDLSLSLQGEVVWANASPPKDMGIRFLELDRQSKKLLKENIGSVGFFTLIRQLGQSLP